MVDSTRTSSLHPTHTLQGKECGIAPMPVLWNLTHVPLSSPAHHRRTPSPQSHTPTRARDQITAATTIATFKETVRQHQPSLPIPPFFKPTSTHPFPSTDFERDPPPHVKMSLLLVTNSKAPTVPHPQKQNAAPCQDTAG